MTETTGEAVRLTRFSHGAGCACKLSPRDLTHVGSVQFVFESKTHGQHGISAQDIP